MTYGSLGGHEGALEGSSFPLKADEELFLRSLGPYRQSETGNGRSLLGYFGDRLAILSRIGGAIIYASREVAHDGLSAAHHA